MICKNCNKEYDEADDYEIQWHEYNYCKVISQLRKIKTKEEQLWEVSESRMKEFNEKYPSEEVLHSLNLRELALRLNLGGRE